MIMKCVQIQNSYDMSNIMLDDTQLSYDMQIVIAFNMYTQEAKGQIPHVLINH